MKTMSRRITALAGILFVAALLLIASRNWTLRAGVFDSPPPIFVPWLSQGIPAAGPDQSEKAVRSTTFDSPLPVYLPYIHVREEGAGPAWVVGQPVEGGCEPARCP
jgi:hypothetical protein